MPARNAGDVIDAQLTALASQAVDVPWELIVVDHRSTDDTARRVLAWSDRFPSMRLVDGTSAASIPEARNLGLAEATGTLLIHCDADDVVGDGWLAAMVGALQHAPLVTGPLDLTMLNDRSAARWRGDLPVDHPPRWYGFLPCALTCNLGVRREVIDRIGAFDPAFRSGSDVDFTWRAGEAGFDIDFAPGALVHRRHPAGPLAFWRRRVRYGRYAPLLWKRHRRSGMPPSSLLRSVATWGWLGLCLPYLLTDTRRWQWLTHAGNRVGRLIGSIEHRSLYL